MRNVVIAGVLALIAAYSIAVAVMYLNLVESVFQSMGSVL